MRISPGAGLHAEDDLDLDWGLVLAAERYAAGADIHDGRALLCKYRDSAEMLKRYPKSRYYAERKAMAEDALRSLLSGRRTVEQATQVHRDWWKNVGKKLHEAEWPETT